MCVGVAALEPRVGEHPSITSARRVQPPTLRSLMRFPKDSFANNLQLYGDPPPPCSNGFTISPHPYSGSVELVPTSSSKKHKLSGCLTWPLLASSWRGSSSSSSACSTWCTTDAEPHATRRKKDSIDGSGEERGYQGKSAPIPSPFFHVRIW
jgi:hypothetical protein